MGRVQELKAVVAALDFKNRLVGELTARIAELEEDIGNAGVAMQKLQREVDERDARIAELEAERDALQKAFSGAIEDVDRSWRFSDTQQHEHSWHDKQDCLERLRSALEKR